MLNFNDILYTQDLIDKRHLDIRTITMGISLLDCTDTDVKSCASKIYDKIDGDKLLAHINAVLGTPSAPQAPQDLSQTTVFPGIN